MNAPASAFETEFARAMELRRQRDWPGASQVLADLVAAAGPAASPAWRGRLVECLARAGDREAACREAQPLLSAEMRGAGFLDAVAWLLELGELDLGRAIFERVEVDLRYLPEVMLMRTRFLEAAAGRQPTLLDFAATPGLLDAVRRVTVTLAQVHPDQPAAATPEPPRPRQRQDPAERRAQLEAALQEDPLAMPARRELLRLLVREPEAALPHWEFLFRAHPGSLDHALGFARAAAIVKNVPAALEAWQAVCALREDLVEPRLAVALALLALDQHEAGVEALLVVLASPCLEQGIFAAALRHFLRHAEDRLAGMDVLERRLAAEPHRREFRDALLELLSRETDFPLKFQRLERIGKCLPDDLSIAATLAMWSAREQADESALAFAERWLALCPRDTEAQLHRLALLAALDRVPEAIAGHIAFLDERPDHYDGLMALGGLYRRCDRTPEAIAAWRRAARLRPLDVEPWLYVIRELAGLERDEEALAAFDEWRASRGDEPEALLAYGRVMDAARWHDRAEAFYRAAAEALPGDPRPMLELGRLFLDIGRMDRALPLLRAARQADPRNLGLATELARATEALEMAGVDVVAAARPAPDGPPILMPDRLFERLGDFVAMARPHHLEPVPGRVLLANSSLGPGGAERQLVTTIRGLDAGRQGIESLFLLCMSLDPMLGRDFYLPGVRATQCTVLPLDALPTPREDTDPVTRAMQPVFEPLPPELKSTCRLFSLIRQVRPEVVHAWQDTTGMAMGLAAVMAGVPKILLSMRSLPPPRSRWLLRRWMSPVYHALLATPGVRMLHNSRAGAEAYAAWLGVPVDSMGVIYNGVDLGLMDAGRDPAQSAGIKARLGIPADAPVVGGVFRIEDVKRPALWAEVAAHVARARPDVHFVVCGEGGMAEQMRQVARVHGIADRLHLPGKHSQVAVWYGLMDVVLLTSRYEGLPNALIEAQHFGLPVVVPRVGGVAETFEDGVTGFAVPEETAPALGERVLHCLTDRAWRDRARSLAPELARRRFGIGRMVEETLAAYGLAGRAAG